MQAHAEFFLPPTLMLYGKTSPMRPAKSGGSCVVEMTGWCESQLFLFPSSMRSENSLCRMQVIRVLVYSLGCLLGDFPAHHLVLPIKYKGFRARICLCIQGLG